jgi:hypothetical protein
MITAMSSARLLTCGLFLMTAACGPGKETADTDSTALPAIDTLKVATDSMPARDTVAPTPAKTATPIAGTKADTKTATNTGTKTPATAKTKSGRDSILGYDKATPLNPKNKLLDTVTKRPPR